MRGSESAAEAAATQARAHVQDAPLHQDAVSTRV